MCEMVIKCFFLKIWVIDEFKKFFYFVYEVVLLNIFENFLDLIEILLVENVRNCCEIVFWNFLIEEKKRINFFILNKCERVLR